MKFPNIEAERGRKGWTKEELVKQIGVSTKTYSNWQDGRTDVPCARLVTLANLFGCSVDYLIGFDQHNNESA